MIRTKLFLLPLVLLFISILPTHAQTCDGTPVIITPKVTITNVATGNTQLNPVDGYLTATVCIIDFFPDLEIDVRFDEFNGDPANVENYTIVWGDGTADDVLVAGSMATPFDVTHTYSLETTTAGFTGMGNPMDGVYSGVNLPYAMSVTANFVGEASCTST